MTDDYKNATSAWQFGKNRSSYEKTREFLKKARHAREILI